MFEKNDYSHEKAIVEINKLHQSEMQLCMSIIYIPLLRDVLAKHISSFIDKSSSAGNNRRHIGLTKLVVGTRYIENNQLVLSSIERSADEDKKVRTKSNIECVLSIIFMQLKLIEERIADGEVSESDYAEIGGQLKYLNFHQNIRIDIYKKTDVIFECCRKVERALQIFIRKNVEFYTVHTPSLLMAGEFDKELFEEQELHLTEEEFIKLRKEFTEKCRDELTDLCSACGVEDVNEVMIFWQNIKSLSAKYRNIKECRDSFVLSNQPFVRSVINQTLSKNLKQLDADSRRDKLDCYLSSSITMLLEKVYKYNPEFSFTTFAKKYIEQECSNCMSNDDIVKLPPVYANKQGEVLQAGLTVSNGKEYFDEELALITMRRKYPAMHWTSDIIADVRFKNTKSTISMHQDEEKEGLGYENRLSDESANPENEAEYSQWAISVVKAISTLPNTHRERAIQKLGITETLLNEFHQKTRNSNNGVIERAHILNELLKPSEQ
ncbi:hypothetical protein ACV4QK_21125 (plasmid) [Alteromonas macleodii]